MKKLLVAAAMATALMCTAGQVAAATIVLDSNGFGTFGDTVSGSFTDVWTVTFPSSGLAGESVTAVKLSSQAGITFSDVLFDASMLTQTSFGNVQNFEIDNLAVSGGLHTLTVKGSAPSGGSYGGSLTFAPKGVPEPASWAMMIGGFFGLGAMLRRRRAQATLA
jgi:hypothetical protein